MKSRQVWLALLKLAASQSTHGHSTVRRLGHIKVSLLPQRGESKPTWCQRANVLVKPTHSSVIQGPASRPSNGSVAAAACKHQGEAGNTAGTNDCNFTQTRH